MLPLLGSNDSIAMSYIGLMYALLPINRITDLLISYFEQLYILFSDGRSVESQNKCLSLVLVVDGVRNSQRKSMCHFRSLLRTEIDNPVSCIGP